MAEEETARKPFARLLDRVGRPAHRCAVVHPVDALSLSGALEAQRLGLIDPILIGNRNKIMAAAEVAALDVSGLELVDVPHSHAAADEAVRLAAEGNASIIMKGHIATGELMAACVRREGGLRTQRRMSHVFVMETPAWSKWILISDGAINIAPDLPTKRWITQNAIDLAIALGIDTPLTAILSATELVDPAILSTIDAAALCKMADRGQIRGGILDGPLAFDLAMSPEAVLAKGLYSPVAGAADILIVPGIEAGNMLAKQLDYLAGAEAAGIVLGAKVPIVLTSRADSPAERAASAALAAAYLVWQNRPE
ncbi:MAG: bifunctional enoyl-CoA hydratase/phosphate acetyltransferase [Hyphomonas sp.]|uniref:bifunctional enoyl-CoA hydratase/phosphate acetyltransferase n=1 Tax=Hyphomonas sp. TaxID=87 RepID=UPI00185BFCE3|nr:bifunctional enoyl-CoA hydratase/phosphate acetyltransferase [Hyphomonas sp.]MBA3067933.1 bifunctional enoyl-CoA hydratase/phosphate acetyltransferase [Hyphomonas sp.]MBU3920775.1 bifunctional enoyl-CoA hydratase/phosphate acetyltransferase [Alphaproteobacteria bacterium]MBU4061270.1 bifunctional enoyl-CoA hydratase/phosphate acetyltransferase [Alphaproteobacteria bacterium]MBU4162523.1 bifunctional enoyl-CoA hydratase/phosphate acetyltransferase [Alphaproteobacteria bacterium]